PRLTPTPLFNNLVGVFAIGTAMLPGYRDSSYDPASAEMEALLTAGMPPDMFGPPTANSSHGSYLESQGNTSWTSLECGNVRASDPSYVGAIGEYRYWERIRDPQVARSLGAISTTGALKRPLISVHGTMDATAPIFGSRLYRADVVSQGRMAMHRLYEI